MSTKSFKNIPKPARKPTAEDIARFETTGRAGRKLHPDAAIDTEAQKSASPVSRVAGDVETREPAKPETQKSAFVETRISALPETRETEDTEIRLSTNPHTGEPAKPEFREEVEPVVRLTVDLPEGAHLRFKAACAMSRRTMVQEVRELIERRTVELEGRRLLH